MLHAGSQWRCCLEFCTCRCRSSQAGGGQDRDDRRDEGPRRGAGLAGGRGRRDDADVAGDSEDLADVDDTDDGDEEVDGELSLLERVSLLEGNAAEYEDDEEEEVGDEDVDDEDLVDEDGTEDDEDEDGEVDVIDDMYEENPVVTLTAAMSEAVQTLSKKSEDLLVEAQKYEATDTAKTAAEQAMKEFQDAYDKELKTKGSTWEAEVLAKAKQASLIQTNTTDDEVDDEEEVGEEGDAVDEDDEEEEVADDDDDSEEDELDPIDDMDEENAVVTLVAAMSENVQTLSKKSEDLLVEAQKYNSTETAQNAAEQALKEFQAAFDLELKEKGTKWEDEVFAKAEQAKNPVKASPPAADAAEASPPAADAATDHAKTPA